MDKPKIRFKGYIDDWEQRKLGEIVERVTRKNQDLVSTLPLTISAQYGLIDQNEFFDKRVASKDVSGYYLVKKGEFAYNKSTSSDAPWGAIKRLDRYENGVLSTLYIVFAINKNVEIDSDYLVTYYDTDLWHRGIREIAAEGARNHGLLNIAPADFFETSLTVPQDIEEQKAIGKYFTELDSLITLHQRKCDETKKLKKYMLQKMFPQNGANVPEIRFDGFTDAWEQRKFGSCNELITGYPFESEKFTEQGIKLVRGINVKRGYLDFADEICMRWDSSKGLENFLLDNNDILIQMDGALIGKSYAKIKESQLPALLVQRVTRARTKRKIADSSFMYQTIQRDFLNYIAMNKTETAVPHLSLNDIKEFKIKVPSLEEQQRIGSFFDALDHLITLHQHKCEELQNIKKFMMQNMFV